MSSSDGSLNTSSHLAQQDDIRRFLRDRWHAPKGSPGNRQLRRAWEGLPRAWVGHLCRALIEASSDEQRVERLMEMGSSELVDRLNEVFEIPEEQSKRPLVVDLSPDEKWREWKAAHYPSWQR